MSGMVDATKRNFLSPDFIGVFYSYSAHFYKTGKTYKILFRSDFLIHRLLCGMFLCGCYDG